MNQNLKGIRRNRQIRAHEAYLGRLEPKLLDVQLQLRSRHLDPQRRKELEGERRGLERQIKAAKEKLEELSGQPEDSAAK